MLSKRAETLSTIEGWFVVVKLPNSVYAFFEPGHQEQVNSFLIIGTERNLLFDTGMGIVSIKRVLEELIVYENLAFRDLLVINSHSHLDHIGGNAEFNKVFILNNDLGIKKLKKGIKKGTFTEYIADLTPPPYAPGGFNPKEFSIPPLSEDKIGTLEEGEVIDLGNRKFEIIRTFGHTEDSICLYDEENGLLFTGDSFHPKWILTRDPVLFEKDLKKLLTLPKKYHYNSHDDQLIDLGCMDKVHRAAQHLNTHKIEYNNITFAGFPVKQYDVDGTQFILCPELLSSA